MDQVRKLPPRPQTWNLLWHCALGRPCLRNSAGIRLSVSVRRSEQTTSFGLEREPVLPLVPVSGVVASDGEGQHRPGRFLLLEGELPLGRTTLPGSYCKGEPARLYNTSRHREFLIYRRNNEGINCIKVKPRTLDDMF